MGARIETLYVPPLILILLIVLLPVTPVLGSAIQDLWNGQGFSESLYRTFERGFWWGGLPLEWMFLFAIFVYKMYERLVVQPRIVIEDGVLEVPGILLASRVSRLGLEDVQDIRERTNSLERRLVLDCGRAFPNISSLYFESPALYEEFQAVLTEEWRKARGRTASQVAEGAEGDSALEDDEEAPAKDPEDEPRSG